MTGIRLQPRFVLAGFLLVAATVASSAWSAYSFARLNAAVDDALRVSQETIDLSAEIQSSLEREDDALLLFVSGNRERARLELSVERRRGDDAFGRLIDRLRDGGEEDERNIAADLRVHTDRYREAADAMQASEPRTDGLDAYHRKVNPLLRQAVGACDRLREANFRSMRQIGVRARDEAAHGARLVVAISACAILLAVGVAVWLARSILGPVRELSDSVEDVRRGNFDRRVRHIAADELGRLGAGFNRMAEALAEYRRSSLGELLAAKATLEATLNALPDAVLVFGPDGDLASANPPAQRILAAQRVGTNAGLADIPLADAHRRSIADALVGRPTVAERLDFGQSFNVVLNGQTRRFLLQVVPIPEFVPGRCGAVVVLDDVTDFARLDELRSELIAVASHELKSPLTSLRMNLLMLGEEASRMSSRQRELVDAAVAGSEELGLTIEELLDLTRVEAGQLRLNLTPMDPATVIAAVERNVRIRFDDARVDLRTVLPANRILIRGDPARLGRVFANVLSNALKYSPPGSAVEVRFTSRQNAVEDGGVSLQIAVTDQGPGIPPEFRDRIFEKFFRVEHFAEDRPENVRGTGIGLYFCRQIVLAHGGTIACEPGERGIGTRFVITLPADL